MVVARRKEAAHLFSQVKRHFPPRGGPRRTHEGRSGRTLSTNSSRRPQPSDGQLTTRYEKPIFARASARSRTTSHGSEIERSLARTTEAGSRPAAWAARSSTAVFRSSDSTEPNECHTSACRAAMGMVRRSPPAPIQIGGCGCWTGRGWYVARSILGHEEPHDLHRLFQPLGSFPDRRERDAELSMFPFEPGGSDGKLEPSSGDPIHSHGLRRQDGGVAVGHSRHERAQSDPLCRGGQGGEEGPPLHAGAARVTVEGLEMVEDPCAVEPALLGESGPPQELRPVELML
jgi:hypothetical protein